jgi:hypothetical protein
MLRTLLLCLLVSFSAPALALYKCKSGDKITYSDQQCPGGEVLEPASGSSADDIAQARKQAEDEKRQAKRLENVRRKRELQEEKEQQRAAHERAVKQKRCALLAQRKKWAEEDAAGATGRSAEKAVIKARRMADSFELECGKFTFAS